MAPMWKQKLWHRLRNGQIGGAQFRRQHPAGDYTLHFYCPALRLAIELDGGGHNFRSKESLDQERTRFLASKGILVLRFWNDQVDEQLDSVLQTIWLALEQSKNPTP